MQGARGRRNRSSDQQVAPGKRRRRNAQAATHGGRATSGFTPATPKNAGQQPTSRSGLGRAPGTSAGDGGVAHSLRSDGKYAPPLRSERADYALAASGMSGDQANAVTAATPARATLAQQMVSELIAASHARSRLRVEEQQTATLRQSAAASAPGASAPATPVARCLDPQAKSLSTASALAKSSPEERQQHLNRAEVGLSNARALVQARC